jgi:outer membrane protein assembly factor BamC
MNARNRFMNLSRPALAVAALALVAGCSGFGSKTTEYKGASARVTQPLEVPPELTTPTSDDRYAIPDPRSQTSYSQYSQRTPGAAAPSSGGVPAVLPPISSARMERYGDQRWLVVKGDASLVWKAVRDFWIDSGYTLARESPEVGIMETDWAEDRARIPDDIIRRTVGRVLPNMYSTPRRDKFRTRLEKGSEAGTTEVFVSNRQVEEVLNTNMDTSKWTPRPADRELEAEMLARILAKMGNAERIAAATPANTGRTAVASAAPGSAATPAAANAVLENSGNGPLVVNDGFDRAWRRVGLALDRVGFTVEDRDRSKGLFYVRYIDPEADATQKKSEGFVDKLMFWKSPPKTAQPQYRIHVGDAGAGLSQVQVQNGQGAPEASSTGRKILSLLYDQLK